MIKLRVFRHGLTAVFLLCSVILSAEDIPGSKDPEGMKRYEGSSIVAYRAPDYNEFLLPLGRITDLFPTKYSKSKKVEGLVITTPQLDAIAKPPLV